MKVTLRLQQRCFPVNIAKFLRTPIFKNICERLLLVSKNLELENKPVGKFKSCYHIISNYKNDTDPKFMGLVIRSSSDMLINAFYQT